MPAGQPNILVIMVDQLAPAFLPAYGHPVVKAPNIDALASSGVVFDSAYCNSPLCSPSRAVFMTGALPSRTGVYDNAAEFRADIPTWAHHLRRLGYRTTLSGKMHFCGPDQLQRLRGAAHHRHLPGRLWLDARLGPPARAAELVPQHVVRHRCRPLHPHQPARLRRRGGVRGRAGPLRPCARVGPAALLPRGLADPPTRPVRHHARLLGPLPRRGHRLPRVAPPNEIDPHTARLRHVCDMDAVVLTDEQVRAARHAYFGAISYVDANVGRLMAALRATGLADSTVVVFTGDHGEMLGERGLWYKMSWFEGACRVPLIVSAPSRFAPARVGASVSLVDVLPTLVELGGADPAGLDGIDGASLVPHLDGRGGRDGVVGEYLAEGAVSPLVMLPPRALEVRARPRRPRPALRP